MAHRLFTVDSTTLAPEARVMVTDWRREQTLWFVYTCCGDLVVLQRDGYLRKYQLRERVDSQTYRATLLEVV